MIGEPNPDQNTAKVFNQTKQNQNQQSTHESGNLPPQSENIPIEIRTSQIPLNMEDNLSVEESINSSIKSSIKSINSQIGLHGLNQMDQIEIQRRQMHYFLSISHQDSEKASQMSMEIDDNASFRNQTLSQKNFCSGSAQCIKNQKMIQRGNHQLNARIPHQNILPNNAPNKGKQSSFDYAQQSECSQSSFLESNRSQELNSFSRHFPKTPLSDGPSFMSPEPSTESNSSNSCTQSNIKIQSHQDSSSSSDQPRSKIQVPKIQRTNMMMQFNSKFKEKNRSQPIQSKVRTDSPNQKFPQMLGSRKRYFKRRSSLERTGFNIWEKMGET